jgi:hypothetical protein
MHNGHGKQNVFGCELSLKVATWEDEGDGRVTPYLSVIQRCFSVAQNVYRMAQKSLEAAFLLYNLKLLQQINSIKYSWASSHLMWLLAFLLLDVRCHETFAPPCVLNNELDRMWKEALMTRFLIVLWNLSGGGIEIGRLSQAEI